MAVIGIYDADFFRYENVIPNLECAKLVTYFRHHKDIAVLTPIFAPEQYTSFYIRKEYNDGIFPKEFFQDNCIYGGRAFNPDRYVQLEKRIENTIPDMHIYDNYLSYFGSVQMHQKQLKRILNCAHMRLAPDSEHLRSFDEFSPYFQKGITGIFLHDYDLAGLHAYDLIEQLQNQRSYITKEGINPYPVGNKYPINIYNSAELEKWFKIVTIPNAFFLEYHGMMDDRTLYRLCLDNRRMARQVYYDVTYDCQDENDFFVHRAEKIFIQSLFLRRAGIKILLKYEDGFFKTAALKRFIDLLNCMISFQWCEGLMPLSQTLYAFCRNNAKLHYQSWAFLTVDVSVEECREIFQYFRINNYALFSKFYEMDRVTLKGDEFHEC